MTLGFYGGDSSKVTKEHCHSCGKLWSEESPECVFNYHKKPESITANDFSCPHRMLTRTDKGYRCVDCNRIAEVRFS
jgi:hypothetical protein